MLVSDSGDTLEWISGDEPTNVRNLPDGVYTLHEEVAPNGYKVATDIVFVIENSRVTRIDNTDVDADAAIVMIDDALETTTTTTWISGEKAETGDRTTTATTATTPVTSETATETQTDTQTTATTAATTVTTTAAMPKNGVNPNTGSVRTGDSAPTAVAVVGILMCAAAIAVRKRRDDGQ